LDVESLEISVSRQNHRSCWPTVPFYSAKNCRLRQVIIVSKLKKKRRLCEKGSFVIELLSSVRIPLPGPCPNRSIRTHSVPIWNIVSCLVSGCGPPSDKRANAFFAIASIMSTAIGPFGALTRKIRFPFSYTSLRNLRNQDSRTRLSRIRAAPTDSCRRFWFSSN
jgi:hypothetical protein